jgi:RNA polymerase sigma factor (TIGR02999 family)
LDVSELLIRWSNGDKSVENQLFALLQPSLHTIAVRQLKQQKHATMRPTELANDVLMHLHQGQFKFSDSKEVYALAARMIRFFVVDYHRNKSTLKRGSDFEFVPLDSLSENQAEASPTHDWVEVSQAISMLEIEDVRCAKLVELRFFLGNTIEEAANALSMSTATADRLWRFSRAYLFNQLTTGKPALAV